MGDDDFFHDWSAQPESDFDSTLHPVLGGRNIEPSFDLFDGNEESASIDPLGAVPAIGAAVGEARSQTWQRHSFAPAWSEHATSSAPDQLDPDDLTAPSLGRGAASIADPSPNAIPVQMQMQLASSSFATSNSGQQLQLVAPSPEPTVQPLSASARASVMYSDHSRFVSCEIGRFHNPSQLLEASAYVSGGRQGHGRVRVGAAGSLQSPVDSTHKAVLTSEYSSTPSTAEDFLSFDNTESAGGATLHQSAKCMTLEEKRLVRLERNRESARQSRWRKKQYIELLESRAKSLQTGVAEARTAHAGAALVVLDEQRRALLFEIEPLATRALENPGSLGALEVLLLSDVAAQLIERFGPDCVERRAAREHHFDQLTRLLSPSHAKFLLWLVHLPESPNDAESGGRSPQSLWALLSAEMGLSADQGERFRLQLRSALSSTSAPTETWRLGVAAAYLHRLRAAVSASAARAQAQLEKARSILSPAQLVLYFCWAERNRERLAGAVEVCVAGAT